jgi:hypothetical protein
MSDNQSAQNYPITYYTLSISIEGIELPRYPGSQLRGTFGYSLKKVCCINPSFECKECFALSQCLYYEFYEDKDRAHKYRFLPSSGGTQTKFELILYAKSTEKLPYILSALKAMIEEQGLGAGRKLGKLKSVSDNGVTIYDGKNFSLSGVSPAQFTPKPLSKKLLIRFVTPLRLKSNGQRVHSDEIEITKICVSILNRYDELLDMPRKKQFFLSRATEINREFAFEDTARYSNRQKTKMNLGGFIGKILYDNVDEQTANILQLGELIGVGKSCVFGLGKIKLEEGE